MERMCAHVIDEQAADQLRPLQQAFLKPVCIVRFLFLKIRLIKLKSFSDSGCRRPVTPASLVSMGNNTPNATKTEDANPQSDGTERAIEFHKQLSKKQNSKMPEKLLKLYAKYRSQENSNPRFQTYFVENICARIVTKDDDFDALRSLSFHIVPNFFLTFQRSLALVKESCSIFIEDDIFLTKHVRVEKKCFL